MLTAREPEFVLGRDTQFRRSMTTYIAMVCVLTLALTAAIWQLTVKKSMTRVTAFFEQAVGLYVGSDVRVLGVRIGTIEAVQPEGPLVRVVLAIEGDVPVPANAKAAVIAPALVSDRYVQLIPAYSEGPKLADGAVIKREQTATPVELDEVYSSLNKLTTALGPGGANKNGALSNLLTTGARNLDGNGKTIRDSIMRFGDAARTLSGNEEKLFSTVDNLAKFTKALADSDGQIHDFSQRLADVSTFLAGERQNFAAAANQLATALGQVQAFVKDNRAAFKSNVDNLASLTRVLVDQKAALTDMLTMLPLALSNFTHTYDANNGALASRFLDPCAFAPTPDPSSGKRNPKCEYPDPTARAANLSREAAMCVQLSRMSGNRLPPAVAEKCEQAGMPKQPPPVTTKPADPKDAPPLPLSSQPTQPRSSTGAPPSSVPSQGGTSQPGSSTGTGSPSTGSSGSSTGGAK